MSDAKILVNIYDGARQPLDSGAKWSARLIDGRSVSERQENLHDGQGPSMLASVPFFDNFFDNYTVIVSIDDYEDAGWFPVRVHPTAPSAIDLLALPKNGEINFANATWANLRATRPGVAEIVERGCDGSDDAANKYGAVLEERSKPLACFLNIVTALADVNLPSGKSPLDYYWNIAWPQGDGGADWLTRLDQVFLQDRFFCYVDASILPDLRAAAKLGSFAPEPNPSAFHSDATESYKQTQFDVANVQLTFHGRDTCKQPGPGGEALNCVKIEPDIDYYKDLLSHGLLEVLPNVATHGRTEPSMAYALRWMAGSRAGLPSFNPLYTVLSSPKPPQTDAKLAAKHPKRRIFVTKLN